MKTVSMQFIENLMTCIHLQRYCGVAAQRCFYSQSLSPDTSKDIAKNLLSPQTVRPKLRSTSNRTKPWKAS
ncbi:hypothetical protein BH10BAC4_BH10BAC4_06880 [soil metagenome]